MERVYSDFELKVMTTKPSELPKAMISPYRGTKTIPETSRSLVEAIKNRYMYQRALLDEVAWQMIYRGVTNRLETEYGSKNWMII